MSRGQKLISETHKSSNFSFQRSLLVQGAAWLGCFGMLSGGMVWAESSTPVSEEAASTQEIPTPTVEAEAVPIAPETAPEPEWSPAPRAESAPEPTASEAIAPQAYEIPAEPTPQLEPTAQTAPRNDSYIDPTDYSLGATETYEAPEQVVITDRSGGCSTVVGGVATPCGANPDSSPVETPVANRTPGQSSPISAWSPEKTPKPAAQEAIASSPSSSPAVTTASAPSNYVDLGPVRVSSEGVNFIGTNPAVKAYFNRLRPPSRLGNVNLGMIFPLAIPAQITSVFGWRTHPIFGDSRFHSGTDLGAPMGTPVLAALAGKVASAEFMGGYGLTVVLEHKNATTETLYAHLSELFVRPGQEIKQGQLIGSVGSTGNSTGPHLHFELRQKTETGWVTLDPGQQLEYALGQFTNYLQFAQANPQAVKALEKLKQPNANLIPVEKMPFVAVRKSTDVTAPVATQPVVPPVTQTANRPYR